MKLSNPSKYYLFVFAALGIISPFLGLWLKDILKPEDFKYALISYYSTVIIFPVLFGYIAFKNGNQNRNLVIITLISFVSSLLLIKNYDNLLLTCFFIFIFGAFYNSIMPVLEAITYQNNSNPKDYSKIRVFGSYGFAISSFIIGYFVIKNPILFPYIVSFLLLIASIISFTYLNKDKNSTKSLNRNFDTNYFDTQFTIDLDSISKTKLNSGFDFKKVLKLSKLWTIVFLTQAAFACYYTFFAIHLNQIFNLFFIVTLFFAIATISEILAFCKMDWFFKKFSTKTLLMLSSSSLILRWICLAISPFINMYLALFLILFFQITHIFGFAVFHSCSLKIIDENIKKEDQGLYQGLYNSVGYGFGASIGVFIGSVIWENYNTIGVFIFAAILSTISLLVISLSKFKNK